MKAAALLSASLLAASGVALPAAAQTAPESAAAPAPCTPEHGLNFICNMINVEDMLPVDGGKAIIAGSFKDASVGFYLIDPATKTSKVVALSAAAKPDPIYSECPGAPDFTKLSTHGLDVRPGRNGMATLYAINHGSGRESVEVFNLDSRGGKAEWVGCVVAPAGTSANSVVGLPDKSIVFTKLMDTKAPGGIGLVLQGQVTGTVFHWVPGKGVSEVPGTQLSGDNGLLASPDGKTLYINAYGTREVWKVPLNGKGKPTSAKVEFNPDNLRWAPDGSIFVTGQFLHPDNLKGPNDWGVARLNPETMYVRTAITAPGTAVFDNATTAIQIGNTLWLGTFKGDRVAYMPAP